MRFIFSYFGFLGFSCAPKQDIYTCERYDEVSGLRIKQSATVRLGLRELRPPACEGVDTWQSDWHRQMRMSILTVFLPSETSREKREANKSGKSREDPSERPNNINDDDNDNDDDDDDEEEAHLSASRKNE